MKTTIEKINVNPGQRIIAMSDIHGHLDNMVQLLRKVNYSEDDVLILVGDLIDKGPDSLQTLRYVMDLKKNNPVYISQGNVDVSRIQILCDETDSGGRRFLDFAHRLQEFWGCGLILDMLGALGLSVSHLTPENADACRKMLCEHYTPEITFLQTRPTILDMDSYLFVHGGIPTDNLDSLAGTDASEWLKTDHFLENGYRFSRCVVVGHWPVSLYRHQEGNLKPLFDFDRKIISIDGGCGVQAAGQINALIFPDKNTDMRELKWDSYDGFPKVTALEKQEKKSFSLYIQYPDSQVDIKEEKGEIVLCRHKKSGKEIWVPLEFTYTSKVNGSKSVDNFHDGMLEIYPGDTISAIYCGPSGCYGKKDSITGWYYGKYQESPPAMELLPGRPKEEKMRRPREKAVYNLLDELGISYFHMDHQEAKNMKICKRIEEVLDAVICKNLFLRNQQASRFYLLMMPGNKKFKTKELSKQINSARLSFAEAEYMEQFLQISPGSVSVMGLMNDVENQVQLLMDRDVLSGEFFGCHPCVNTSSIRLRMEDLLNTILPAMHHKPIFVELKGE